MKRFYLHNGTESFGPFDKDELRKLQIRQDTPVWFDGLPGWNPAGTIEELEDVFGIVRSSYAAGSAPKRRVWWEKIHF